jgi:hypothetical protein
MAQQHRLLSCSVTCVSLLVAVATHCLPVASRKSRYLLTSRISKTVQGTQFHDSTLELSMASLQSYSMQ